MGEDVMEVQIVRQLIERLNQKGIRYCHWKSNQHIQNVFNGIDDIDMLIASDEILQFNCIINDLGFKRFILPWQRAYIAVEDYLAFDDEHAMFIHLHLHYGLTLGEKHLKGYQLPIEFQVLKHRIFRNDYKIYTSSPEDETCLLLLRLAMKIRHRDKFRIVLNRSYFGTSANEEFKWLKEHTDSEHLEKRMNELFHNANVTECLINSYNSCLNKKYMNSLKHCISKEWKMYSNGTNFEKTLLRWRREIFRVWQVIHNYLGGGFRSYRRIPLAGGIAISFVGPDGSGKSSMIQAVEKELKKVVDVKKIYLGSGDGNSSLLRKPLRILYKIFLRLQFLDRKDKRINLDGSTTHTNKSRTGQFLRSYGMGLWVYTLSKERIRKMYQLSKYKNKGYVVLTDRFPQSQIYDLCDGPKYLIGRTPKTIFQKMIKRIENNCFYLADSLPMDLILVFNVSPETALKRKPDEVSIETHKKLMEATMKIKWNPHAERVVINADLPFDMIKKQILSAIWEKM